MPFNCKNGSEEVILECHGREDASRNISRSAQYEEPSSIPELNNKILPKKINIQNILDILNSKFNIFNKEIAKDLSTEPVGNVVKRMMLHVDTLLDLIPLTEHPAIMSPPSLTKASATYITYNQMHKFIEKSFNLAKFNFSRGDRVAVCLAEGPVLNLCLLSTMAYCICVPSNSKLTPNELLKDFKNLKVKAVIVPFEKLVNQKGDALINCLRQAGLKLIGLRTASDSDIEFTLVNDPLNPEVNDIIAETVPLNKANDVVMLVQTSGTTGQKKIVPYRLETLCISTICVVFSLDIKYTDTIINMMPLFHVGGIIRSLLTTVFSGGSIIQCQGFDPVLFCDILENQTNPIWFYGVPSMHQSIIREAIMRKLSSESCNQVKKICNAGAALSPSLANQIKSIFTQTAILPSYGMTECMPISAPPLDYGLELDGSSGRVIGPDLAISVDDNITRDENIIGRICVRGGPCFCGYEGVDDSVTFDKDGWFDTGDMGYLKKGFLYITGRSKEVINRGGEILSPLEIENALMSHPRVAQVIVFSVPHDTLQETVGCAIVTHDPHIRPDLRSLRNFLNDKLHSSKHPQLIVYMQDIPKSNVGKVLRLNFSNQLNIPTITNDVVPSQLLFEADCTSNENSVNFISSRVVEWSVDDVVEVVKKYPQIFAAAAHYNVDSNKFFLFIASNNENVDEELVQNIETYLHSQVHDYMLPTDIIIVQQHVFNDGKSIDEKTLEKLVQLHQQLRKTDDPVALVLCDIFGLAIGMPKDSEGNVTPFPADGNFFDYGGNSLKSGFIKSLIRTKLGVTLPVTTFYEENYQTPNELAVICRENMSKDHVLLTEGYDKFRMEEESNANSRSSDKKTHLRPLSGEINPFNPWIMLFQASPIYLMQPLKHVTSWIFFVYLMNILSSSIRITLNMEVPHFVLLLTALLITGIISEVAFPIIGILMKWLVIGRYKAGTYKLWGQYYLRWWFINKLLFITGIGIFKLNYTLYALYLRLMGAKVGRNCRISCDAKIQEYDLITIGSDCYIDDCVMRPFVLSRGHMNLYNIVVSDSCVLGFRANIVAGTKLASGTVLGPQTTTYTRDMQAGSGSSAHKDTVEGVKLRDLCKVAMPEPHCILEYLVGWPVVITTHAISHIPWFYCLYLLMMNSSFSEKSNFAEFILHFADLKRLKYYIVARVVRRYFVHLLYIVLVILIKRLIIGKFRVGVRKIDQISVLRHWLMKTLLSLEKWQLVATIVGSHYEVISIIYRLLGAKVGKRVYWPGTNIHLVEFDLLTVGNDVIFGSRSHVLCGDATEFAAVTIEDGAMCADNCVILPGSRIGRDAILGSGGLLKKHFNLADGSIWYGSYNGNAVKLRDSAINPKNVSSNADVRGNGHIKSSNATIVSMGYDGDDTSRPFGRAFYERKADYFVLPLVFIIFYNSIILCASTILWTMPLFVSLQLTALYIRSGTDYNVPSNNHPEVIIIFFYITSIFYTLTSVVALCFEIVAKWALFGRRQQGSYNWDKSSYCQRWQVLISVQQAFRDTTLTLIGGSSWIVLFFRALGCKIGKRVCLYPSNGDPVMTEPDLVVLDDDVAIDRAALICHLNTLGDFSINPLHVGEGSVLQNDSRLGAGASMREDCTLLDRSYITSGEIAEANSVWQGYPAIKTTLQEQYSLYAVKKLK